MVDGILEPELPSQSVGMITFGPSEVRISGDWLRATSQTSVYMAEGKSGRNEWVSQDASFWS